MTRAVIQAGGRGARLHPYTTVLPKPLMPIGEAPILEIVVQQLVHHGIRDITITVGHLGHLIVAVLGDGSRWGARIGYTWEKSPRGTIGALSEVPAGDGPVLVMNGDLLTDFDFSAFLAAHRAGGTPLSVGVYNKRVPISLGVLDVDPDNRAVGFREKPVLSFPCSMGIYALEPGLVARVPREGVFGFDDLMHLCLGQGIDVRVHPFDGLWLDIGRPEDYAEATKLFHENVGRFLPAAEPGRPATANPSAAHAALVN